MDWNAISAWAALLAALAAIIALYLQSRLARFAINLDMLWRFESQFRNDERMLKRRRSAAIALLNNENNSDVDEVLNFFEQLGLLMRKKAIDKEVVWYSFYNCAIGYWTAAKSYILQERSKDITIWIDYNYLYNELLKIEKKKTKKTLKQLEYSKEYIDEFLSDESKIT